MDARLYQVLPVIALASFIVSGLLISMRPTLTSARGAWVAPAALACLFLGWTLFTVFQEGTLGFWREHIHGAWGNQVWFDLLLGGGSAFALLAERAKAVGMRLVPWFLLIGCTGGIGLLAMVARYMFLAEHTEAPAAHP